MKWRLMDMNLMSLFNFGYIKENIKKSRSIILLSIFLLPIINSIILLIYGSNGGKFVSSMNDMSFVILIGMYLIPIMLSLSLFGFVFRNGSSVFTLSLPITKKQLFLSNTLIGILVILFMQVFNLILTLIVISLYSNIVIPYRMVFDAFIIYFVCYVFIFVISNIGVCVSFNKISSVIVTLLILFLVPFINNFISSNGFNYNGYDTRIKCMDCKDISYVCNDSKCDRDMANNIYMTSGRRVDGFIYTIPYNNIKMFIFGNRYDVFSVNKSLIKMFILSILYIFIGIYLFTRRKFEISDTSFGSDKIHIIVRSLTTIPILCIVYFIVSNTGFSMSDLFSFILILAIIMAYLIIYDLITKKRVTNIFIMFICLLVIGGLVTSIGEITKKRSVIFSSSDIDYLTILDEDGNVIGKTYNRDISDYSSKRMISSDDEYFYKYRMIASTKKGDYYFDVVVNRDEYNFINDKLSLDDNYIKGYDRYTDNSRIFGIGLKDGYINVRSSSNMSDIILDEYRNRDNIIINKYSDESDLFSSSLYFYDNYTVRRIDIDIVNRDVMLDMVRYYNANTRDFLMGNNNSVYYYEISNSDSYFDNVNSAKEFVIRHINDNIDIDSDYVFVVLHTYSNSYVFVTNSTDEIGNLKKVSDGDMDEAVND